MMSSVVRPWGFRWCGHTTSLFLLLSLAACGEIPTMDRLCCGVSGLVTDAATRGAVVGATISAGGKVAQTDANGRYGIGNVRDAGPNLVRVTHPDYETTERWIDITLVQIRLTFNSAGDVSREASRSGFRHPLIGEAIADVPIEIGAL